MKKCIISFILGSIIFSGITGLALNLASRDVSYDNTSSHSEKTNVQDAIDDLYEKAGNNLGEIVELASTVSTQSRNLNIPLNDNLSNYKYIIIGTNTTLDNKLILTVGSGVTIMAIDGVDHFMDNKITGYYHAGASGNGVYANVDCSYVDDTTVNISRANASGLSFRIYGIK